MPSPHQAALHTVRALTPADLDAVIGIDAELTGERKEHYWREVLSRFLGTTTAIALGVEEDGRLAGFLCGEVRAFEFGSRACGWIFAIGVRQSASRVGVASALVAEADRLFRALGVDSVRTMVKRAEVPLLSLFRSHGFVGGPFVQLELDLTGEAPDGD